MPDRKSAHGSGCLRPIDMYGVYTCARRTAVEALKKCFEGRFGPLGDDPHGSVGLVADPSVHTQAACVLHGEVAEADALNAAGNVRFQMFRYVRHRAVGSVFSRLLDEG